MCAAQGGKTNTGLIAACYTLANDPGPFMWTLPAQDEAKTFSKTRLKNCIENCEPVARLLPNGRYGTNILEIEFATAPLILVGTGSGSKVSGKPIRYAFIDEEKDYESGVVEKILKRVRSKWNSKVWRMSTPSQHEDSIHRAFLAGDQRYYHVPCPKCSKSHAMSHENFGYDANGFVIKSVWYECPTIDCGYRWFDTPEDRAMLDDSGYWVAHNPDCDPGDRSWTWSAILPRWVEWRSIALEEINARRALRIGDKGPLRVLMNETFCKPAEEEDTNPDVSIRHFPYKQRAIDDVKRKEPGEVSRFLTVDRGDEQGDDHRWICLRAWFQDGASRLLYYGKIHTTDNVRAFQLEAEVEDRFVMQDSGYDKEEVYLESHEYGWLACKGTGESNFSHPKKDIKGKTIGYVHKPFSRVQEVMARPRARGRLILLASDRLKDIAAYLRSQQGPAWEIPEDVGPEYLKQLLKETKEEKRNPFTGQIEMRWIARKRNHAWDCEYYQVAMALMSGILTG
jgi:phage terminase large subunit GpA-like protein